MVVMAKKTQAKAGFAAVVCCCAVKKKKEGNKEIKGEKERRGVYIRDGLVIIRIPFSPKNLHPRLK